LIIPNDIIVDAKHKFGDEAANIIAVELGIENYDSKNLKGRCPFHNDSTPSFVWNSKDDAFKCFGCGKRYGILDHYTQFHKISFLQAVEKLFELTGTKYQFGERGVKLDKSYIYPTHEQSEDRNTVESYMKKRKISPHLFGLLNCLKAVVVLGIPLNLSLPGSRVMAMKR